MKIIQLTDTHLLSNNSHLFGLNPRCALKKALKSINKNHSDAKFIVITGDLANSGEFEAYKELKEILKDSKIPVFLLLGNHDLKDNFNKVFNTCKNNEFVQYKKRFDNKVFLFLSTIVENEDYGTLCKKRLLWLDKQLQKYKENDVYIFMHHFPLDSNLPWMDDNAYFKDKGKFWKKIIKYQNVKHIFTGHLHRTVDANFMGIGVSSIRSTNFQVAYVPNSCDDYLTNEEKPSYSIIDINKKSMLIHHHEFMNEHKIYISNGY